MDAYQCLTAGLPARVPAGHSHRGSEKSVRDAVAALPLANPARAVPAVEQVLDGMLATTWRGRERVAALAHLQKPVATLCAGVERQLGLEAHPLPSASAERAEAAQRLESKLADSYAWSLHELCAPEGKVPLFKGKLAAAACVAGLQHAAQVLVWAYRRYQAPPAGVWRRLHALYAFAATSGLTDQACAVDESGGTASARTVYAQALLLALSNPYRLSTRELQEAIAVIGCIAPTCRFARAEGSIGVDTHADAGPGYVVDERLGAGTEVMAFDIEPAKAALAGCMAGVSAGAGTVEVPQPGGGVATTVAFLQRLQAGWAAAPRNHARLAAAHTLDAMVGMHALHFALAGGVDFATFIRRVHGEAITVGRHELASAWLSGSDVVRPHAVRGEVLDQSEGGYRLRLDGADGVRLRIGEVIGLAPPVEEGGQRDWMIGVIRWLRIEADGDLLGIELLHRTARAAGVRPVEGNGETLVPRRAVELPDPEAADRLVLLMTNPFAPGVDAAEVVLPALASDWRGEASVDVWRCAASETLGAACIRVTLVRGDSAAPRS